MGTAADAVNAYAIPPGADLDIGYVDGHYLSYSAMVSLRRAPVVWPNSVLAQVLRQYGIVVFDCETGNAGPAAVAGACKARGGPVFLWIADPLGYPHLSVPGLPVAPVMVQDRWFAAFDLSSTYGTFPANAPANASIIYCNRATVATVVAALAAVGLRFSDASEWAHTVTPPPPPPPPPAPAFVAAWARPQGDGYWLARADGRVLAFGRATVANATALKLNQPIMGGFSSADGKGIALVAADGGVFCFGDTPFEGSEGGKPLNARVVGGALTHSGHGYWLVAADGGVFSFGDAPYGGSQGSSHLNAPIVGMARTPSDGYWLAAHDGGIFSEGGAPFEGSLGSKPLNGPIMAMAATPDGKGYWLAGSDGGVFALGDAKFFGSHGGQPLNQPVMSIAATPDGKGYWLFAADGGVFCYGDAAFHGSGVGTKAEAVA